MSAHTFTPPAPAGHAAATTAAARAITRRALGIFVVCACAGAGLVAGAWRAPGVDVVAPVHLHARAVARGAAADTEALAATRGALRELGLRDVATCDARCSPQPAVAALRIAALRPQAVIVAGASADAAVFVHGLRAAGSHAMVVLIAPADPAEVVQRLPEGERSWIATATQTEPVQLAVVGRHGAPAD